MPDGAEKSPCTGKIRQMMRFANHIQLMQQIELNSPDFLNL